MTCQLITVINLIWGSGGCIYNKKLRRIWCRGWVEVPSLFFGREVGQECGTRKVHMKFRNFRDNGPDAMSVGFHVKTFLPFFFIGQKYPANPCARWASWT